MSLFPDLVSGHAGFTFARPWLLLFLVAIPLIAYLKGKRGAAAAVTFSSTSLLHELGKTSVSRAGKLLEMFSFGW